MALIQCPECGKQVSDKAKVCPDCGFPIESLNPDGIVRIKLSPIKTGPTGFQKVTIRKSFNNEVIYEGKVGDIVELKLEEPTEVFVNYHASGMHFSGVVKYVLDPNKSTKYQVYPRRGVMTTNLICQPVEIFDAD